jgi:hypothetical protein
VSALLDLARSEPFLSFVLRPLQVLLNTVQCFFAKQVRVFLTSLGKFDDLVGDDLVTSRVSIFTSKRGADHLVCYAHNPHGLGIK